MKNVCRPEPLRFLLPFTASFGVPVAEGSGRLFFSSIRIGAGAAVSALHRHLGSPSGARPGPVPFLAHTEPGS